jgi:hypothetical protein
MTNQRTPQFGACVRTRHLELGKSQEQLAEASDLYWSYLGQVERGVANQTRITSASRIILPDAATCQLR